MAVTAARGQVVLGRYRVVEELGRGAFGRVLAVVDLESGEQRALKLGARDDLVLAEFELLARLSHSALPRVFEVGRTVEAVGDVAAGASFFVAEWIAGGAGDTRLWGARAPWGLLADGAGAPPPIPPARLRPRGVPPA